MYYSISSVICPAYESCRVRSIFWDLVFNTATHYVGLSYCVFYHRCKLFRSNIYIVHCNQNCILTISYRCRLSCWNHRTRHDRQNRTRRNNTRLDKKNRQSAHISRERVYYTHPACRNETIKRHATQYEKERKEEILSVFSSSR